MKVIVTGGAGFIGRYVCCELESRGHSVDVFDRTAGRDVLVDPLPAADAVIHLSGKLGTAELFDEAEAAIRTNVIGVTRILSQCEYLGMRFVGITVPDNDWRNVYFATKRAAKDLVSAWHEHKGVPACHVRAYNAYGVGQLYGPGHPQKIIPTFATLGWRNEPLPIWGDGRQVLDLVPVTDIARMLVDGLDYGDDQTFEAGTHVGMTVNDVAELVLAITGSNAGVVHLPMRPGETPHARVLPSWDRWSETVNTLGWEPQRTVADLGHVIHSYKGDS